tara:strand:+ start:563 stop:946 length:384 start_codon:yes stop_codon:yes gene_type:complete
MSIPIVAQITKIYEAGDTNPEAIVADGHFHQVTITTQPLNIPVGDEDKPLKEVLIETNAVDKGSMSGTIQLTAAPPRTFEYYEIPEGLIDLSNPTFLTTTIPLQKLRPIFSGITGSTHVAITISSYS